MLKKLLALLLALLPAICFGQIATLSGTGESITVVLGGAAATTNPTYNIAWSAGSGGTASSVGSFNGATPVTALAGPDSGTVRNVANISLYNADTATATITVNKVAAGTTFPLLKQALNPGATLTWNERAGVIISQTTAPPNVGAAAGTGVSVSETGNGAIQKTTFTLLNVPLTMRDTQQGGGLNIYNFPEGRIIILGTTGSVNFTTTSALASTLHASVSCRWGLGTTTQANATLATTEQDLIPVTTFTSSATINVANTATSAALAASAQFDGTATAKKAFLNISVPTGTDIDADATVLANGTLNVAWIFVGDY